MLFHVWVFDERRELIYSKELHPSAKAEGLIGLNLDSYLPAILHLVEVSQEMGEKEGSGARTIAVAGLQLVVFQTQHNTVALSTIQGLRPNLFDGFANSVVDLMQGSDGDKNFSEAIDSLAEELRTKISLAKDKIVHKADVEFWNQQVEASLDLAGVRKVKYLLVGNWAAGKSSVYYQFFENWSDAKLEKIRPTVDKWIANYNSSSDERFTIYDLGGQEQYRKKHLQDETLFSNLRCVIFVVDVQNLGNVEEVLGYYSKVLGRVREAGETPHIAVFLHKVDPDRRFDLYPNIRQWLNHLRPLFSGYYVNWYLTSIKDDSAREAMARTMLYTIPKQLLEQTLSRKLITQIYDDLQPLLTKLLEANTPESVAEVQQTIFENAKPYGYEKTQELIREWIRTIQEVGGVGKVSVEPADFTVKSADRRVAVCLKCPLKPEQRIHPGVCEITHGLFEGLGLSVGLEDAQLIQTEIRDKTDECIIELSY